MAAKNLKDMFVDLLQDAYSAETQLTKALPKMARAADNAQLKAGFEQHLRETEQQVRRLEQVARACDCELDGNTCEAMEGLIEEGEEIIAMSAEPDARDAGLIASAQKVEHYEIATYGTLCAWADQLGMTDAKNILGQTLNEEKATDEKLTRLAESMVNVHAAR
ncbi:MAG TPA: ferritin-like domain-containing protein [Fimbriiglobus sp.]|jgi:ferritin-like metal-binding protein YciE|nr:ferritin-like domain-containing protein [Fimbriiglobus sp.]